MTRKYSNSQDRSGDAITVINISAGNKDGHSLGRACERLNDVDLKVNLICADSEDLDVDEKAFLELMKEARKADLVILKIHGDPSYFKKYDRLRELIDDTGENVFFDCSSPEIMKENRHLFRFPDNDYDLFRSFVELGGSENERSLLLWVGKNIGGIGSIEVPEPIRPRAQGVYHPDHPLDVDLDSYLSALDPSRPTVGIMFHQLYWLNRNTDSIDALIRTIERMGANTIPVFFITSPSEVTGSIGVIDLIREYLMKGNAPRVDSVIINCGFSQLSLSNPGDGSVERETYNFFEELGVAVLQAPTLNRSREAWKEDMVGMGPIELASSVIWPEFDGQIITVPLSFSERNENGEYRHRFVPDRVERIASLALEWAVLRKTPVPERKVAILLNMYPPNNDRLGGAGGLDTFESIRNLLHAMHRTGYRIERLPENGKEVLDEVLAGVTNDLEWIVPEEIPERAADMVDLDGYLKWFEALPPTPREGICRCWGDPPGEITTLDGKFIMPGVANGNVFIGIEPNRGHHAQAEKLYHSTDVVMPHSYLAYYRWVKHGFGANALIHMGTHGTLEWLPGKGNALSEDCYPDAVQGVMPNLYPYIIDDPGEGVEAKRRTNSVLVEYMVPTMTRAEGYDRLADLDADLQGYLNSVTTGQREKVEMLSERIFNTVKELSMFQELGLSSDATEQEVLDKAELLYDYISELKDALIKDGLHIMGSPPEGDRLEEMVYSLTRLRNGPIPSMRGSVAASMGHVLSELLDRPSAIDPTTGTLNGTLIDSIDSKCQELLRGIIDAGFDKARSLDLVSSHCPSEDLRTTVSYICDTLYPNILRIRDEIDNLVLGLDAGYVPPGPSGPPTRGNAHLLPTGRNFYSINPDAIPSEVCWKIGKRMADDMIDRHVKENACYPRNVGIIIWATDTMKTGGDDIAYILWLMGLRPKWGSVGGRVVGLEAIPISELGRPRIDVTVRISGMFRDSFPGLVELIDEGVEMIASLDESDDENYLLRHLKEDIQRLIREGLSPTKAKERSMIRVFGDPPGEHGVGVDVLIESSKWNTLEDIAETYVTWGCHAYGRKWKGEKMPEAFKGKMASMDVTVKNHEDREFDLLDIDDDYSILGGMNATVRFFGDHKPLSIMGDSSDPDRLKMRTLEEECSYVMRSRVLNPKYLEGLKEHGFRGAQELSKLTEYVLGWDATSDIIEPWMYESITDHFLRDKENREWIKENNPFALREMASRLLEAINRELWDAPQEYKDLLASIYLEAESALEEAYDEE